MLFIFFINDIAAELSPDMFIHIFTNDALLYHRIDTHEDRRPQEESSQAAIMGQPMGNEFQHRKMLFDAHHDPALEKGNRVNPLPDAGRGAGACEKYLGASISSDLSWKPHNATAEGKPMG